MTRHTSRRRRRTAFTVVVLLALSAATALASPERGSVSAAGPAPASLFVSSTGSDAGTCTRTQPCQTFDRAYALAHLGQTVEVAAGTYDSQTLSAPPKTGTGVVTFQAAAGATVTIAGELRTRKQNHLEFRNMDLGDFYLLFSSDVTFRNVSMRFFFIRSSDHISLLGGSVGGVQSGISPTIGNYNPGDPSSSAILIDGVLFHDVGRALSPESHIECLFVQETSGLVIRNSRFTHCDVMDLYFNHVSGGPQPTDVTLENNWFDEPVGGGYAIDVRWNPGDVISNWVVRYNSFDATALFYEGGVYQNFEVYGNVGRISGCDTPGIKYAYNVWSNLRCASTDRVAPPGYLDPAHFDLHLSGASGARGGGDPLRSPRRDIEGHLRPLRMAPDAGADQAETALIVLGQSIGNVRLGMTQADVVTLYGAPARTATAGSQLLVSYKRHRGVLRVSYQNGRVVGIWTNSAYYVTEGGFGVRAPLAAGPATRPASCSGFFRRTSRGVVVDVGTVVRGKTPVVASISMGASRPGSC